MLLIHTHPPSILPVGTPGVSDQVPEAMPKEILKSTELVMDWNKMELLEMLRLFELDFTWKVPEYNKI